MIGLAMRSVTWNRFPIKNLWLIPCFFHLWNEVTCTLSHLASSTNGCSGCRMRMSHPMQPSCCWNGEIGISCSESPVFERHPPPEVIRWAQRAAAAPAKQKKHQQQHRKNKSRTQTEKSSSVKVTVICTREKIKFAV